MEQSTRGMANRFSRFFSTGIYSPNRFKYPVQRLDVEKFKRYKNGERNEDGFIDLESEKEKEVIFFSTPKMKMEKKLKEMHFIIN